MIHKNNFLNRYNNSRSKDKAIKSAISASVQHNPTYSIEIEPNEKKNIRKAWKNNLIEIGELFTKSKSLEFYLKTVNEFQSKMSEFNSFLSPNKNNFDDGFRIAHSQKSISVYLKHLWCLDLIPEPPCCPVDRIIATKAGVQLNENWTQMNSIESLYFALNEFTKIAKNENKTLAMWELQLFANNLMEIKKILYNSIFYPCSGLDGLSFRLANLILPEFEIQNHFFVDYLIEKEVFLSEIKKIKGYEITKIQELAEKEITPNGWNPQWPPMLNIEKYKSEIRRWQANSRPFACHVELTRQSDFGIEHGQPKMNLLFIKGDALATFQATYINQGISPIITIVKSAGWGWGAGYEDFRNPDGSMEYIMLKSLQMNSEILIVTESENDLKWESISKIKSIGELNHPLFLSKIKK